MEHQDTIKSLNTKIVVISFGSPLRVRKYLAECGCPFDVLCDEKRELYKCLGLKTSVSRGWKIEELARPAEKLALHQKMQTRFEKEPDDPVQMGGDFILDKNGCFKLVHTMKTSTDRPTVAKIVATLKEL